MDFLFQCHRAAPFLFFNGNTFGEIARRIVDAVFIEFPLARRREAASLGRTLRCGRAGPQIHGKRTLATGRVGADFKSGDRVKTLKGSMNGKILRVLPDGRVVWRADSGAELTSLPESLIRQKKK